MKTNKILGLILVLVGVIIILAVLYHSFAIFTGKKEAPEIFKAPVSQTEERPDLMQKEMEKAIGEQIQKMLPADSLEKLLNLISWSVLAGILIFGGAQISSIGTKLLKS